ncbi:alpha/beta fold hydrolase [Amaricoccus macauensis]|uniref:alpha/beta fold hydrolase n=1 Tax=Amaricoccus macauensis TaxID=57001 RepID=UPI003C7AA112
MTEQPPILFLHGAFSGPEVWNTFVAPWFAQRGHKVSVPRLPGPTKGPATLRDYVDAAMAAAEDLGGRPVVVGHSFGGLIAQHLAARRRVSGAVLVSSPGPCGLAPSFWQLSARYPDVLAATLVVQAGAGDLLGIDMIRRALFTPETPDDWIMEFIGTPLTPESPRALFDGLTWDLPAWPLARLTPMLAVLGDQDAFVPVTDLWALGLTYGAETELIRGVAHGLPLDPSWKSLVWRINAWLDERAIGQRRERALAGVA